MNYQCLAEKCCRRAIPPYKFCRFHSPIKSNLIPSKNVKVPIDVIDCPICLDVIGCNEDSGLVCGHRFHIECINKLEKSQCPVCRVPLEVKQSSNVNLNKIKIKEEEEKIKAVNKEIADDEEYARRLQDDNSSQEDDEDDLQIINMFDMINMFNIITSNMLGSIEEDDLSLAIENSLVAAEGV